MTMTVDKRNFGTLDNEKHYILGGTNKCCAIALLITATLIVLCNYANEKISVYDFTRAYMYPSLQPQCEVIRKRISSAGNFSPLRNRHNVLVDESTTYTSTLGHLLRSKAENVSECLGIRTKTIHLNNLPETMSGLPIFRADHVYHLIIESFEEHGGSRCAGGDYYEVDLHHKEHSSYRSRLPTVDFLNGSYGLEFTVPSRFSGEFVLDIWLLFTDWHGMDFLDPGPRNYTLIFTQELKVVVDEDDIIARDSRPHSSSLKQISKCNLQDFDRTTWQGRWTRSWLNDSCQADNQKRYRCLPGEHYWCEEPWCTGPVGRLESNGWSYSAHCSFKIFERDEAWECLDGRWFLMWGDSNFQDTIRNLLLFILEWDLPPGADLAHFQLERAFDRAFINPSRKDQLFRVSLVFNGHHDIYLNGEGLKTLQYKEHQDTLLSQFNASSKRSPDTIVMNSGLHDGSFLGVEDYSEAADFVIHWWVQLYERIPADRKPILIWRTSIAPAGPSRLMQSNPNKLEVYNLVMVEKLQQARHKYRLPVKFVDAFDMSFPFHYNLEYSDGGHYGRAPGVDLPPWFTTPHWYFVDIMLAHVILNIACPDQVER